MAAFAHCYLSVIEREDVRRIHAIRAPLADWRESRLGQQHSRMQLRSLSAGPLTASSRALISHRGLPPPSTLRAPGAGALRSGGSLRLRRLAERAQ